MLCRRSLRPPDGGLLLRLGTVGKLIRVVGGSLQACRFDFDGEVDVVGGECVTAGDDIALEDLKTLAGDRMVMLGDTHGAVEAIKDIVCHTDRNIDGGLFNGERSSPKQDTVVVRITRSDSMRKVEVPSKDVRRIRPIDDTESIASSDVVVGFTSRRGLFHLPLAQDGMGFFVTLRNGVSVDGEGVMIGVRRSVGQVGSVEVVGRCLSQGGQAQCCDED